MAKREKPPVEKYHDRVAGIYDTIYDGNPYWEATFELTWRHVQRVLPRNANLRCLDVGCGTGRWGMRLLKSGFHTDFLDISHKMLEQVRKKVEKFDRLPYVPERYHTSIEAMPMIADNTYDFIIGQGDPLGSAGIPERTLKELTRILKPGGQMMMSVDNAFGGMFHYLREADVAGLDEFLRSGKTNWVTDDEREQYEVIAFTPDKIRKLCAARGLQIVSLIGKTALPLRRFQDVLRDREKREQLLQIEERLSTVEAMLGCAAHIEFVARKPLPGEAIPAEKDGQSTARQPSADRCTETTDNAPQTGEETPVLDKKAAKEERRKAKLAARQAANPNPGISKYARKKLEQSGDLPESDSAAD